MDAQDVGVHHEQEGPVGTEGRSSGSAPRLADLQSITDSALAVLSLEEMLSELLERIRGALGADTAAILLLEEEQGVLVARAARGLEEEVRQGVQVPLARGFAGRVAAERRPIIIDDLDHFEVVNPILRQKGIRSMLGVPVHVEGRVIGVMHIGTLRRRDFDEGDVTLLQLAADWAAVGIDNARLSEQRAVTEVMQRTLLPDALPQIPGIRFSAKYLPAGSGVKVGGDWYDVFQLPSGRVALVIGDVVGRGVLAASVMAEIRTTLRAYLVEGHRLTHAIRLLNEMLVGMGRTRGATLSALELDLEQEELDILTAGHLPPLLLTPDGEPCLLEQPPALPIGIRAGESYEACRYDFPSGSTLLLYTDGLVERRGEAIDEGLARLQNAALEASRRTDASFADRVYRGLLEDVAFDDDLALLVVESVPLGTIVEITLPARPLVVAGLRGTLARWLTSIGAGENDTFDIALSTSEAVTNSIEHAYGAREADLTVRCDYAAGVVTVTVSDDGRWRSSRPRGGGRGIGIMRNLMDSVEIESDERGTVVTMTKQIATEE